MRLRVLATVVLLAAAMGVAGCAAPSDDAQGNWVLTSGTGADGKLELVRSHPVTLDIDETSAGGTAACNSYGGQVSRAQGGWRVTELFQTEMACEPAEVMTLESAYLTALAAVTRAQTTENELTLTGPDGVELVFARGPIE